MSILPDFTFDIESSGLSEESYPVSIGIAGPHGFSWSCIIAPMEHWDFWDILVEDVHGFSRETLIERGRDPFLVAREINHLFSDKTLLADSVWDEFWLKRLFSDVGVKPSFTICTLSVLNKNEQLIITNEINLTEWDHVAELDATKLYEILTRNIECE